jgi:AAA domain
VSFQVKDSLSVQFTKAPAIAIAGPSGSGKTESAMRLARGFVGPNEKFVIVDTEEKRALYKKARYQPWDWVDFQAPFTPERYWEVMDFVKHYKAVIIDSASHEYSGPGGLQEIHQQTLDRMTRGDDSKADKLSGPAWKDAKMRHKSALMSRLIRYPTMVIFCLRAEPKIKFVKVSKDGRERTEIVDAGYQPICERQFMFEMLVGCMMTPEEAGIPQHVKRLEMDLEPVFPAGQQIDEDTGRRLSAYCTDRVRKQQTASEPLKPDELADLLATLDVKTLPALKTVFEAAYTRANELRDKSARAAIKAKYDEVKTSLEAQQI